GSSPTATVSCASRLSSSQAGGRVGMIMTTFYCVVSRRKPAAGDGWRVLATCLGGPGGRYRGREVGGGRTTRQPGQVRKEAALTSTDRVARQPPTESTASLACAGASA